MRARDKRKLLDIIEKVRLTARMKGSRNFDIVTIIHVGYVGILVLIRRKHGGRFSD